MRIAIIILLSLAFYTTVNAQISITVIQSKWIGDTIPYVELVDYEVLETKKVNDSTTTFLIDPKTPESLFIGCDPISGWFTRIWIDPKVKKKTVILNYSNETAKVINPNKDDIFYEKIFKYFMSNDPSEGDSVLSRYVKAHPADYFSLHIVTHGLYHTDRAKLIDALNLIQPYFKDHPDFKRTKARLLETKYPNTGDPFKEFTLIDINNKEFSSASISNKYILINFWSNGCAPCVKEMDSLVSLYNSLDTSKVEFISISMDDKQAGWINGKATNKIKWINL